MGVATEEEEEEAAAAKVKAAMEEFDALHPQTAQEEQRLRQEQELEQRAQQQQRLMELDLDALERGWRVRSLPSPASLPSPSPDSMELVKLVLLGAPGVGKTSIVQQFVWNDFSDEYVPTERKHTYYPSVIINDRLYELKISDIPVIPYFPVNSFYEWTDYRFYGLRSATAYVLVFDLANADTFQYIRALREQMVESRDMRNVPLLVVGNKQDLIVAAGSTNGAGSAGASSGLLTSGGGYALCAPGGGGGGGGVSGAGPSGVGGGGPYALCPVGGGSGCGTGGSGPGAGAISWGGTADFREKRRDIVNLVKKNWKCGYVECSAKYNWRVVAVFKELMRAVDALETVPPGKDAWSPMTDNLHGALDRNRCVLL